MRQEFQRERERGFHIGLVEARKRLRRARRHEQGIEISSFRFSASSPAVKTMSIDVLPAKHSADTMRWPCSERMATARPSAVTDETFAAG